MSVNLKMYERLRIPINTGSGGNATKVHRWAAESDEKSGKNIFKIIQRIR